MKRTLHTLALLVLTLLCGAQTASAVTIQKTQGWFESGYVTWDIESGATYTVFYRPEGGTYQQLDKELVRLYKDYGRADIVGLKAGNYQFKVVSSQSGEAESEVFTAAAHDRSGFAHVGMAEGIGAYKNDGTLKDNARVLYVTAKTAKTVKCNVMGDKDVEYTGLQAIIAAYEKGKEMRPLDVRIIGTVKKEDMDDFGSKAEGVQVKGKNGSTNMNITIEGIGNDATVHGFGFLVRSAKSVEFRNFAIMICLDDCLSLDTDNHNVWVHNMDFFYGGTGSDSDQAKGDGTVDIKGQSSHVTISYNHFFDSGKCSLGGMKSETTNCWMTYHHNWFDHSDSRHPRIRTAFYHVYNNYFDGNSKYGVGVTMGGSAFVEQNYFRNCKYPVLISKQGSDAEGSGTFSGEDGGVIKIYGNVVINPRKLQLYDGEQTDGKWDAVEVDNRGDEVTATCLTGGTGYNNTADAAARNSYTENKIDNADDIPAIVRGEYDGREGLGAGRIDGGDFKWVFNNSLQDENYDVISELKTTLLSYESTAISLGDGTLLSSRTPAEATVDGGDGKALDQDTNDSYTPSWAGGGGSVASGKQVIGEDDAYFWFNSDNDTQYKAYVSAKDITLSASATYNPNYNVTKGDNTPCSDYTGSIRLTNGEYITLYNAAGISTANFYVSGNGSQSWQLSTSTDGTTFTTLGSTITGGAGEHPTVVATLSDPSIKYVRITNKASGTRDVQGVKLYTPLLASDLTALTTETITVKQGEAYTLTAGTDYTTSCTGAISYKSSSPKIATVSEDGKIEALAEGNTTITLTQKGDDVRNGGTLKYKVTVTDTREASDLEVLTRNITLPLGDEIGITYRCSNDGVTVVSGAPSIVEVVSGTVLRAVGYGTVKITVSDPGSTYRRPASDVVTVTVPDLRAESALSVNAEELALEVGETASITVSGNVGSVTYRSTNEEVVTVSADGTVTPMAEGEAGIIVTDEGDSDTKPGSKSVSVNVTDPSLHQPTGEPVTWDLSAASFTKSGSFSASATNIFVSTEGSNAELTYVAGSSCKIDNKQMKMGGATQFSSKQLSTRYFILPPITGSGTLTVVYGDNTPNITISTSTANGEGVIGSITSSNTSAHLTNLDGLTVYVYATSKAYFKSISWTPDATEVNIEAAERKATGNKATLYDISGRKVATPAKGQIYIQNGVKRIY